MSARLRRPLLILGRILVSLLLVGYLLAQTDRTRLVALWDDIALPLLMVAIGLQVTGIFVSSLKWWLLLRTAGERVPYLWLVRLYLIGHFFNNFLPTMVGGDAIRAFHLSRRLGEPATAISSVFVERLTGFLALVVIAWTTFLLLATSVGLDRRVLWIAFWCIAAATAGLVLAFAAPLVIRLLSWLRVPDVLHWRAALGRVRQSLARYTQAPWSLAQVIGFSFVYQILWIATNAAAARAVGIEVSVSVVALMVPLSDIIGLLPIFFNSLGAREGTFVLLLSQWGVATAQAVGLSLLIYGVRLLVSLAGGAVYLLGGAGDERGFAATERIAHEDRD
jgi:uncharacterized protein (TIRG00374 family)